MVFGKKCLHSKTSIQIVGGRGEASATIITVLFFCLKGNETDRIYITRLHIITNRSVNIKLQNY